LTITVELDDDIGAAFESCPVSRECCSANSQILRVVDDSNPWVAAIAFYELTSLLGAGVIDDVDRIALGADVSEHSEDVFTDTVAGNYDGDHASISL